MSLKEFTKAKSDPQNNSGTLYIKIPTLYAMKHMGGHGGRA